MVQLSPEAGGHIPPTQAPWVGPGHWELTESPEGAPMGPVANAGDRLRVRSVSWKGNALGLRTGELVLWPHGSCEGAVTSSPFWVT